MSKTSEKGEADNRIDNRKCVGFDDLNVCPSVGLLCKYRCPRCFGYYCSVACYNSHNNNQMVLCTKAVLLSNDGLKIVTVKESENGSNTTDSNLHCKAISSDGTANFLSEKQKQLILENKFIKNSLTSSKRLRDCILAIDSSEHNRQELLRKKRAVNSEFDNFILQLVSLIKEKS